MIEDRVQVEIRLLQTQFSGLDLGQVQDIIDDGQQVSGRGIDLGQPLRLLGRWLGTLQQMGENDDGIHGGADFMTHIGQEAALGLAGGFGSFQGGA